MNKLEQIIKQSSAQAPGLDERRKQAHSTVAKSILAKLIPAPQPEPEAEYSFEDFETEPMPEEAPAPVARPSFAQHLKQMANEKSRRSALSAALKARG